MATVTLKAKVREVKGKNAMNRLREKGIIPAVVYGKHEDSFPVQLNASEFKHAVHPERMSSVLINLDFPEDKRDTALTIIREIQRDPASGDLLHLDFLYLHEGEELELKVPVLLRGTPEGVKEGGVLEHLSRDIYVKCLPKDIPEHLDVDVSHLEIGSAVHASDLVFENGEILSNANTVIATVLGTRALASALGEGEEGEEEEAEEGSEE